MVKNCDLGLENAARGRRPRAAFSRPWSQFFTIQTSQLAKTYIYVLILYLLLTQCLHYINLHYLQYIYYNTSTLVK